MRNTASFAAAPPLPNWQSDLNPANKWSRSLWWERTVFNLLAEVERLPPSLQGEIGIRVDKYINLARTAVDDATLTRFIEAAAGERERVAREARLAPNPPWTAAALAEAWCVTRLGLSNGTLNRYCAMSVCTAIETFASERGHPCRVSKN
jgi:hypothetical protein